MTGDLAKDLDYSLLSGTDWQIEQVKQTVKCICPTR